MGSKPTMLRPITKNSGHLCLCQQQQTIKYNIFINLNKLNITYLLIIACKCVRVCQNILKQTGLYNCWGILHYFRRGLQCPSGTLSSNEQRFCSEYFSILSLQYLVSLLFTFQIQSLKF